MSAASGYNAERADELLNHARGILELVEADIAVKVEGLTGVQALHLMHAVEVIDWLLGETDKALASGLTAGKDGP